MALNETLKTRVLGGARNVQLGEFMTPGGTGNATPDYVGSSGLEYLGQGLEAFGRGIGKVGDLMNDAKKKQQQDEQNKAESDMYLDVYNIQRTPTDMMTASQKEIAIDRVVNKYSGLVPVSKIHSILNANGAEPEKTYTRMSEQAAKQQSVQKQVDQNEQLAKLATTMDPTYAGASFSSQIAAGRRILSIQNGLTSAFDKVLSLGNASDEQTIVDRNGELDKVAEYAKQLFPSQARVALYSGQWTENDTNAFVTRTALALSQRVNPATGTVLSKQEADFYARTIADRLLASADKERLEASKHTLELQKAWLGIKRNVVGMSGTPEEQRIFLLYNEDPATLEKSYGTQTVREDLAKTMDKLGVTANGHTLIPGSVSNLSLSLMADNSNMPLQQADATKELFLRQGKQQPSLTGNRNSLELIDSRPENWLSTLPADYANENIEAMKRALPKDISMSIQSLVQARLAPQPNEGWFMRAFRAINNEAVDEGTYTSPEDIARVRGVNAEAINSMLTQYVDSLERIGMPEADINDIISSSIQMAGIPKGDGNSRSVIRMAVNSIANGVTEQLRKANPVEAMGNIATSVAQAVSAPSNTQDTKEPELDTIKEQPKEVEVGNSKVDVSSIYDTKAYKLFVRNLVKEVKEERMTEDQAKNEMSVFLSKIGDAFSAVFGVKTAQAEELPAEIYTSPREMFTGPSTEKVNEYLKSIGREPVPFATHKQQKAINKAVKESKVTKTEVKESRPSSAFSKGNADPRDQQGKDVNIEVIELNDGRYALVDGHSGKVGAKRLFEEYGKHYGIFDELDVAKAEKRRVLENLYRFYHGMPSLEEEYQREQENK